MENCRKAPQWRSGGVCGVMQPLSCGVSGVPQMKRCPIQGSRARSAQGCSVGVRRLRLLADDTSGGGVAPPRCRELTPSLPMIKSSTAIRSDWINPKKPRLSDPKSGTDNQWHIPGNTGFPLVYLSANWPMSISELPLQSEEYEALFVLFSL